VIEEPATQHRHGLGLVLDLGLLVLDGNNDAGWLVGDSDRRVGRVDRLPARAGGPVDVDPDVLFVDLDVDFFGMTATVAVEVWIRPLDSVTGIRWTR
jgi:hypothetical protein